jgi:hypothetical protein
MIMTMTPHELAAQAARAAGFDSAEPTMIRDGSNVMLHLGRGVVARIGPRGSGSAAARQVQVSRWLAEAGLPVVTALDGVRQPTMVGDWPVTWWRLLPEHRPGTPAELGVTLRALHSVPPPIDLELPVHDPFAGLAETIYEVSALRDDDRAWLIDRLAGLQDRYKQLSLGETRRVVHGDAWQDNLAVPASGPPILVDLEHVSLGDPDWDLIPIGVDYTDFARVTDLEYASFVTAYGGYDVTTAAGFRACADIQELRWVGYVLSKISTSGEAAREVQHRIACLRGYVPRPWTWTAF